MTNGELLQLNPQHLAELRSFFAGFDFDDVEIVAKETVFNETLEVETCEFFQAEKKLKLDGVFRGADHTHCIFTAGEDETFYCYSYAKVGLCVERIIFKLIRS